MGMGTEGRDRHRKHDTKGIKRATRTPTIQLKGHAVHKAALTYKTRANDTRKAIDAGMIIPL